jgi:hypothetical protein
MDALLFIRNRKAVPHCDLAGFALSAVLLPPPMHQTKSALPFAPSFALGTRRCVRNPGGVEESEEFAEERLQRWNGQSNKRRADLGHFYGQQTVIAPRLIWLYIGNTQVSIRLREVYFEQR